jgi:hypothetical protein
LYRWFPIVTEGIAVAFAPFDFYEVFFRHLRVTVMAEGYFTHDLLSGLRELLAAVVTLEPMEVGHPNSASFSFRSSDGTVGSKFGSGSAGLRMAGVCDMTWSRMADVKSPGVGGSISVSSILPSTR